MARVKPADCCVWNRMTSLGWWGGVRSGRHHGTGIRVTASCGAGRVEQIDRHISIHNFYSCWVRGEVYHYHTKLMMKEAHTGGSFVYVAPGLRVY